MGILTYPNDLNEDADYVEFVHFPYRVNDELSGKTEFSSVVDKHINAPRKGNRIRLYMPNTTPGTEQIQDWKGQTFTGPKGQLAKQFLDEMGDRIGEGGKVGASGDQREGNIVGAGRQLLLDFLGQQVGVDANAALQLGRGVVYNPNVELLYKQPALRKFTFDFNFIPKNADDTRVIDDIIYEFKKWSSPGVEGESFLTIPDLWMVTYGNGRKKGPFARMNPWRPAALEGVITQDNPLSDLHATIEDPEGDTPVHTKLMLSFTETDIITRKDHEESRKMGYKRGY